MKEKDIKTKGKYSPPKLRGQTRPRGVIKKAAAGAGRQARQVAEKEGPPTQNSSQYAQDHVERGAARLARGTVYRGKRLTKGAIRLIRNKAGSTTSESFYKPNAPRSNAPSGNTAGGNAASSSARQQYRVKTVRGWQAARTRNAAKAGLEPARAPSSGQARTSKPAKTLKTGGKGIKTADKGIKAANKGIKTGAKASKATAKTAAKTAKAAAKTSAKLAHAAKVAAKAAATGAKALAKAAAAAAKAIAAAVKALIAAIAAGGWVALLIILVVAVIVLILGSAFGLFFTDEINNGALKQAVVDINNRFSADLQAEIDRLSSGGYDAVVVSYDGDYDGDSPIVNNWQDVLAVFAVKNMYEGEELLNFDESKAAALSLIFNGMNEAHFQTRVETDSSTTVIDGEEVTVTTSTLYINITVESLGYLEGAALYRFDRERLEMLDELMSEDYNGLWAELLDVDIYGGFTQEELDQIAANLPPGTKGGAIVQAALSKAGTAYSVMDCSQLTRYAYAQAGVSLPRTSVAQAKYCYDNGYAVSRGQLMPGDLVFWSKACSCGRWNEIHHTGVYIGGGKIVDASSAKGRVVVRDLWGENGDTWKTVLYARPHI